MTKYSFLLLLGLISCKTYQSNDIEFSNLKEKNEVQLKKVKNFRFLGGIKNSENRTLKDSLIYRSGNLHDLKKSAFKKFDELNIKDVIDLRTLSEIEKEPDRLPKGINYENLRAFEDPSDEMANAKNMVLKGKIKKQDANDRMIDFYNNYLSENPEVIKKIILQILDSEQPILYHCTAGKDRTGMITALLLKILKFDDNIIFEEYLLSNNLRQETNQNRLNLAQSLHFLYPKLDIGVIEKISWIEIDYLKSAFNSIDNKYGSIDNYISQVLNIDDSKRELYIKKFLN